MSMLTPYATASRFSAEAIEEQLDRIFLHPDFINSEILRKFLSFVVRETFRGNANCLKEYTIAVKALDKPASFNPQKSCIVRIHAGRLRRALSQYYNETNPGDEIIIDMPKGKYVPVFMDRRQWLSELKKSRLPYKPSFAILPFLYSSGGKTEADFSDNLCLQICSALSRVEHISVIAYQVVKSIAAKKTGLPEPASRLRFDHVICGSLQFVKQTFLVTINLVDCGSCQQVWSKVFECGTTDSAILDIQEEICRDICKAAGNRKVSIDDAVSLVPPFRS